MIKILLAFVILTYSGSQASKVQEAKADNRDAKLFYVSTTSSTSPLTPLSICYTTAAAITAACGKRRKRELSDAAIDGWDGLPLRPSGVEDVDLDTSQRDLDDLTISDEERQGKFLVYWLTTTSISTSTSFSTTSTIGSLACTPSGFIWSACG